MKLCVLLFLSLVLASPRKGQAQLLRVELLNAAGTPLTELNLTFQHRCRGFGTSDYHHCIQLKAKTDKSGMALFQSPDGYPLSEDQIVTPSGFYVLAEEHRPSQSDAPATAVFHLRRRTLLEMLHDIFPGN